MSCNVKLENFLDMQTPKQLGTPSILSPSALEVFLKWYALYKSTFCLLTYLHTRRTEVLLCSHS